MKIPFGFPTNVTTGSTLIKEQSFTIQIHGQTVVQDCPMPLQARLLVTHLLKLLGFYVCLTFTGLSW
jgi:hypothetical protein